MLAGCGEHPPQAKGSPASSGPPTVTLTPQQMQQISVGAADTQPFASEAEAVGTIDFNQDTTVQVSAPYQGRIGQIFAQLGDPVRRGQPLFTVESPDLITASSTLITAAATEEANKKALDRARTLQASQGISDQSVEAATAAEAGSRAALEAAKSAVAVFGISASNVLHRSRIQPRLVVRSPVSGQVTQRNAQPGLLVQPGMAPAPFTVSDTRQLWMLANAAEADAGKFRVGQPLEASVAAAPGRVFAGRIAAIAANIDPATRTIQLRASLRDPGHLLRAGMQAAFRIHTGIAGTGIALPAAGVVREGDGTMTVWVEVGPRTFAQRVVTIGITHDGLDEVTSGLRPGERVVTKGAIFLDNMLAASATDG